MLWARRFWLKLQSLFRRERSAERLDDEIQFHLDQQIAENIAAGMSPQEARHAAMRTFGNRTLLKEETRDTWGWIWLEQLAQDLRYGARTLRKSPGFTAVAVLTLALGIGANTAIFSLIDAVMLKMLPVHEPQHLVEITRPGGGTISYPFFEAMRDRNEVFSGVLLLSAGHLAASAHFGSADLGEVHVSQVSGNYFDVLGVSPVIGRVLTAEDRDTSNVGVISYGFWQRGFGADPSVLGKTLRLGPDHVCTIVGVAAANFTGLSAGRPMDLWVPVTPSTNPVAFMFRLVARRKSGISEDQALANVQLLARQLGREWNFEGPLRVELTTAGSGLTQLRRRFRRPLLVLMLISALLLFMVALNIGNLLLARASARQQEVGVRLSLGASRSRLIRQLVTESFLLAGAGTALGLLLAPSASGFLVRFLSLSMGVYQFPFSLNGRMLSFTVLACGAVVLLFGIAPALAIMRLDPAKMFCGSHRSQNDPRSARRGKFLMAAQVGISCVLLAGAVLFARSLQALASVDTGFNPQNVLLVNLGVSPAAPKDLDHVRLFESVLQRFATTPGVRSVAISSESLFSGNSWTESVNVPGIPVQRGVDRESVFLVVSPGFFQTMDIPVLRGRDFTLLDDEKAPKVAVVNEAMARFYFPGIDPIGHTFRVDSNSDFTEPLIVVGLVQNSKYKSLKEPSPRIIYLPALQRPGPFEGANFEVRTAGDLPRMADVLWDVARSESPYLRFWGSATQQRLVDSTIAQDRMLAELSGFIGALAAILVCLGLYGLTAYHVSRRTAEIGLRMALGAHRRGVVYMILKSSMVLVLAGAGAGIAAALPLMRVIGSLLFGVHPFDATTLLGTLVILLAISAVATYFPARRAMRVDPMVALRYE
jgi:predicted permease